MDATRRLVMTRGRHAATLTSIAVALVASLITIGILFVPWYGGMYSGTHGGASFVDTFYPRSPDAWGVVPITAILVLTASLGTLVGLGLIASGVAWLGSVLASLSSVTSVAVLIWRTSNPATHQIVYAAVRLSNGRLLVPTWAAPIASRGGPNTALSATAVAATGALLAVGLQNRRPGRAAETSNICGSSLTLKSEVAPLSPQQQSRAGCPRSVSFAMWRPTAELTLRGLGVIGGVCVILAQFLGWSSAHILQYIPGPSGVYFGAPPPDLWRISDALAIPILACTVIAVGVTLRRTSATEQITPARLLFSVLAVVPLGFGVLAWIDPLDPNLGLSGVLRHFPFHVGPGPRLTTLGGLLLAISVSAPWLRHLARSACRRVG